MKAGDAAAVMVPEKVAMAGEHRREHLGDDLRFKARGVTSHIEEADPGDLLADMLGMAAHRAADNEAADLGWAIHRIAQTQIIVTEFLAQDA